MNEQPKMFPMINGPAISIETAKTIYHAYTALYGGVQSFERLAERGGFSWAEVEIIRKEHLRKFKRLPEGFK